MTYRKGEQTKALIVQKASTLFNCQGYAASSISDIMHETGLRKGGIYNHFQSKEELMLSAFSYAIDTMTHHFTEALSGAKGCMQRLLAIASVFEGLAKGEYMPGGCPVMNTAIESDDADPLMRQQAILAMDKLLVTIRDVIESGKRKGEVKEDADAEYVAAMFISMLEGALMMSKLYGDPVYMERSIHHLEGFLTGELSFS